MQALYATGFNAWGQLQFDTTNAKTDGFTNEPDDIQTFTRVLEDSVIKHVRPSLSYTTVTTSNGIVSAGAVPQDGFTGTEDESKLYFSAALNGRVAVYNKSEESLDQFASVEDFTARETTSCIRFTGFPNVLQVVAYDVGFAALTSDGQVWTWGDPRFPESLGRDVTESPAESPGRVTALDDLPTGPIVKLAAGGHVLAAVTQGRDLYCWGGYSGRKPVLPEGVTGEPTPVIVEVTTTDGNTEELDVIDVDVGDGHMIVLAADGSVYVIGSNANGQLGLGNEGQNDDILREEVRLSAWTKVKSLPPGKVTTVYAGQRSSFVVINEET